MVISLTGCSTVTLRREASEIWQPECIGPLRQHSASGLKVTVCGCISYRGVGSLAFVEGNGNYTNSDEALADIWSHQFVNYLVLITSSCRKKMYQFTSPPGLTHGRSGIKKPILPWPARSPGSLSDWTCVLSAKVQSEKSHVFNQHQRRSQAAVELPLWCIRKRSDSSPRRLSMGPSLQDHLTRSLHWPGGKFDVLCIWIGRLGQTPF